jgi:prepilin-type N-terminal cleavage/methylation domain-containing protein
MRKTGFSLLELSIVVAIIALLVSSVVVSRKMVENQKLKTVINEYQKFSIAANSFKLQYEQYPGDFNKAADFFTGLTNGDGDGLIEYDSTSKESWLAWKELVLAGGINGDFSGSGVDSGHGSTASANVPATLFHNMGCWNFLSHADSGIFTSLDMQYNVNILSVGHRWFDNPCVGELFLPNQAYIIDNKIDDGIANDGNVRGMGGQQAPAVSGSAGSTSISTSCHTSGVYQRSLKTVECILHFNFDDN